jgi:small subunit ribosomal protein S6
VFLTYDGGGDVSAELERRFKQSDAVIRFMTVLKDPRDLGRRKNRKKRAEEAAAAAAVPAPAPAPAEVKEEK